jgi:hypothetical protein
MKKVERVIDNGIVKWRAPNPVYAPTKASDLLAGFAHKELHTSRKISKRIVTQKMKMIKRSLGSGRLKVKMTSGIPKR